MPIDTMRKLKQEFRTREEILSCSFVMHCIHYLSTEFSTDNPGQPAGPTNSADAALFIFQMLIRQRKVNLR